MERTLSRSPMDEKHVVSESDRWGHHHEFQGAAQPRLAAIPVDRYAGAPAVVDFDKAAERKLRLKLDLMLIPTVSLLYLFCFIDRANIGNARLAKLEQDLGMTGDKDYNTLLTVFYISYILFEVPANLVCKWMGPGWFIPILTLCFGITSLGTAFVRNLGQACGVRFLLGLFESGMMPGIAYYLSRWYRRSELAFRLSLFIVMSPLAGAFGGLLASAILALDNVAGLRQWRMIFVIEGIITIAIALISFATMTDRPETARWLSPAEKELAIDRVRSERIEQPDLRDRPKRRKAWLGFWNPVVLACGWTFMLNNITVQGLAFFAPTIVGTIYPTYSTVQKQLWTVPPYLVGSFFTLLIPAISWYTDRRQIFVILSAPLVILGYALFLATTNARVRYGATFLLTSSLFSAGPLLNAQVAAQVVSDTSRSVALATNMMIGNVGGIIATWTYLGWDAPDYRIGNGLNLAAATMVFLSSTLLLLWMKWDNKRRDRRAHDRRLHPLSEPDPDLDQLEWRHPAWRWKP